MAIYELKPTCKNGKMEQELYKDGDLVGTVPYPEREPNERFVHRIRCRSYGSDNGTCMKHSHSKGTSHLSMSCTGNCDRMRRYDKEHGLTDKHFLIQVL